MEKSITISLAKSLEKAAEALGRARERLALAPDRDALKRLIRAAEQDALAWLEGSLLDPDRLGIDYGYSPRAWRNWPFTFVRAFERPLSSTSLPDAARVTEWLTRQEANTIVPAGWQASPIASEDRLTAWERAARRSSDLPRMLAGADLAAAFCRAAPLYEGNTVVGVMLAERYALANASLTAGGLVAVGLKRNGTPWRTLVQCAGADDLEGSSLAARDRRCRLAWLNALASGADEVIALDKRLRMWLGKVDAACEGRRRSSNLKALALLAAKRPSLTAARAASALGLSRQATTRLIEEACRHNLLREVTKGNSFRRYVVAI